MRTAERGSAGKWVTWWGVGLLTMLFPARACIQDADTHLDLDEKRKAPTLAQLVGIEPFPVADLEPVRNRIQLLSTNPRKGAPEWWNDLAGAYLRLGNASAAAALLEQVIGHFPNDYGINANLGTAYHLLGEYEKAERYIARDIEIDPNAHGGLEKYHLALLQYLIRDSEYRAAHLYVDEFSRSFVDRPRLQFQPEHGAFHGSLRARAGADAAAGELRSWLAEPGEVAALRGVLTRLVDTQRPPAYRLRWNLAEDRKFKRGVLYLAELNRQEPAAITMLGVLCLHQGQADLASAAFGRAIALNSPQAPLLVEQVEYMNDRRTVIRVRRWSGTAGLMAVVVVGLAMMRAGRTSARRRRRFVSAWRQ